MKAGKTAYMEKLLREKRLIWPHATIFRYVDGDLRVEKTVYEVKPLLLEHKND